MSRCPSDVADGLPDIPEINEGGTGFAASQPHINPRARVKFSRKFYFRSPSVLDGPESGDGPYQNWGLYTLKLEPLRGSIATKPKGLEAI